VYLVSVPMNELSASAQLFDRVRVVLCRPQIAGNVGAIARSMINFGPRELYLVRPKAPHLSHEARHRARAGEPILESAVKVQELPEALAGCVLAIGSTARERATDRANIRPRQAAEAAAEALGRGERVALVFGHETSGMSNLELDQCQIAATIPTCPDMPSLNLAMAATVMLYEVHQAVMDRIGGGAWPPVAREKKKADLPATLEQLEGMYGQMRECLWNGKFLNPQNPDITLRYLRRFFAHSGATDFEVRLWRAIWRRLNNTYLHPKSRRAGNDSQIPVAPRQDAAHH